MEDAVSFAVDSSEQIQGLLATTKGVLSKLYRLVFPKLSQEKTLEELTGTFFVDDDDPMRGGHHVYFLTLPPPLPRSGGRTTNSPRLGA